jgi:putative sporulation protein YtaF
VGNNIFLELIEILVLVIALSIDAFVACFAYGANKIRIPLSSINVLNIVCTAVLGISLFLGEIVESYIPIGVTKLICFFMLFAIGVVKFFDSATRSFINKRNHIDKEIDFSIFNLKFILHIYAKPEAADKDFSKVLSANEAISLAFALSIDGVAAGFGAGVSDISYTMVIITFFIFNLIIMGAGYFLGKKLSEKSEMNIAWVSGLLLMALAVGKLF